MSFQAKAAQYKKDEVQELAKLMREYPVIGIVNVENLPAKPLQVLRLKLRKSVLVKMSKKPLIERAIEIVKGQKNGFENLQKHVIGMPAILFTRDNPFKVSALIGQSKSKAPAKQGQIAPYDLIIEAGPTPFTPGPVISELSAAGLKTGVENGKIVIKAPKTIVKAGEVIDKQAVDLLAKFSIQPMEIGLDLVAAYEDGLIYDRTVLSIKPEEYLKMLQRAAQESLGLTLELGYPTKENIGRLIGKAFTITKNFAIEQKLISDVLLESEITKAERAAMSIAKSAKVE